MTIIGGADGPTQIYIASSVGWLNGFGLALIVLLLLPNAVYAMRHRGMENGCKNKWMNGLEQVGRYGCMLLMALNLGGARRGFSSAEGLAVYLIGNAVLLLAYWSFWVVYAKRPGRFSALMLALLPALMFLFCGVVRRQWLLVGFGMLFGIAHVYVTATHAGTAQK